MHRRTSSDFMMGRAAANSRAWPNPRFNVSRFHCSLSITGPNYTTRQRNVVAARAYRAKYHETYGAWWARDSFRSHKEDINQKIKAKRIKSRANGK